MGRFFRMVPIFTGTVKDGAIVIDAPRPYRMHLGKLEGKRVENIVRLVKKTRSNHQNRYGYAVVWPMLSGATGYTPEEIKEICKQKFALIEDGQFTRVKPTSEMSTIEMEEFYEKIRHWALCDLNIRIPLPNEVDYE